VSGAWVRVQVAGAAARRLLSVVRASWARLLLESAVLLRGPTVGAAPGRLPSVSLQGGRRRSVQPGAVRARLPEPRVRRRRVLSRVRQLSAPGQEICQRGNLQKPFQTMQHLQMPGKVIYKTDRSTI
jgi:hypothetical protein